MSEKFDIFSKIFFRDVGNFVRYLCVLVLRHQMRVWNYFVNSFYSVLNLNDISKDFLEAIKLINGKKCDNLTIGITVKNM